MEVNQLGAAMQAEAEWWFSLRRDATGQTPRPAPAGRELVGNVSVTAFCARWVTVRHFA